ncbi:hypothetical protein AYO20_00141 [Fonsecaea nubica]|uniref:RING-type domain-containing protein n=1 Tax=Fonsecaea nubica TaxID=856822 RepID=A0A178DH87_9EURO|nr:hypothetical protein AYO20_00141 [Fonsecaea nubica]OAL40405.1 hypothetical protein AYO20_00141 [Fonsecaea nubica]
MDEDDVRYSAAGYGSLPSPSPIQSQFDTLFAEFARSRPRVSPPRSPSSLSSAPVSRPPEKKTIDLRALDYVTDYDTNLMCPICHVPFIEPVVLECDHTFCDSCLKEYLNMCNDIQVKCPNEDCEEVIARGYVERHATKECPHERLPCPDPDCGKLVKRKNYVEEQCIHSSHIECDCGAVIELGKGDWLRHKDEDCPNTGVKCKQCGQRISARDYLNGITGHVCGADEDQRCPGRGYGCTEEFYPDDRDEHVKACPLARMAPYLQKQSQLLKSLQEQLAMVKVRNEVLEAGFDKINDIVNDRVLPHIGHSDQSQAGEASDVEEIERDHIPSAISHRDLLMPAHLRALTPSPDPEASSISQTQQHLLALHESLRGTVSNLEQDISAMSNALADLDARSSMQIMNETLRIKEELAHTNAALFSTRSQVQWLLNRERVGQQQQQAGLTRGRAPSAQPHPANTASSARSSVSEGTDGSGQGSNLDSQPSGSANLATSPSFRPQVRRLSGSQERVKL